MRKLFSAGFASTLLLCACAGGGGNVPSPIASSVSATPAPAPSGIATPVGAIATPTATATAAATATATATAKPTATPTPTPSPAAVPQGFSVPVALNQTAPPAPSSTAPPGPSTSAVRRSAFPPSLAGIASRPTSGGRRTLAAANPIVKIATSLGDMRVQLRPDAAPKNVANFLAYVNNGAYTNSIVHRSVPGFIVQGGGYTVASSGTISTIPSIGTVGNEFNLSNVRGTMAMAKVGNDPNSATSQWFFNEANNAGTLDSQNGGFTVIGNLVDTASLAVMDAIGAEPVYTFTAPFDQIPLVNYASGGAVQANNYVTVSSVAALQPHLPFFAGEQALGNAVYFLTLPNGNTFGYYSYLADANYIYHFDFGYEYTFDAADGQSGMYLYDFASGHFLYTSPAFPFPYLYDFSLGSVIYYYPNATSTGHYTTAPRYFYNFKTKAVFSE